ncbi:uncharacterized protein LOC111385119 [Olea europaea var. sylvestris]|uniref:uncharacterized protein LOC111385119 n=1 Tax=Olea europaea var. sylvestris TaxID=158386 RepID=UPI000C1D4CDC|nr:uncharacterized protein LOC111385119 [Olea europaea var. sylvestris]
MANIRQSSAAPFRVPRPTLHSNVEEISSTQVDPNSRNRQIRWSDAMDGCMITALLHEVLSSHKRSDNGFSSYHLSKAIKSVHNGCRVMVFDKNVRARLKTLKKEYVEVRQLLSMSGFGLDPHTGRVTTNVLAWEELLKSKPEFEKWRTKFCSRYDDLEAIFGNDYATGDRAITDNDILSPDHDENVHEVDSQNEDTDPSPIRAPKRNAEGGANKVHRRRTQPNDESLVALSSIA